MIFTENDVRKKTPLGLCDNAYINNTHVIYWNRLEKIPFSGQEMWMYLDGTVQYILLYNVFILQQIWLELQYRATRNQNNESKIEIIIKPFGCTWFYGSQFACHQYSFHIIQSFSVDILKCAASKVIQIYNAMVCVIYWRKCLNRRNKAETRIGEIYDIQN